MPPCRRWSAAQVVLLLALALASCSEAGPRLTQPGGDPDGWFGLRHSLVEAAEPIIMNGEVVLCIDRPGRVEVVDVEIKVVEGPLQVDAFATRPPGNDYPDWLREGETLWDLEYGPAETAVEAVCPEDPHQEGRFVQLGLQLSKATHATARGHTLVVWYVAEGTTRRRKLEIPFGIVLCEGWTTDKHDRIIEECDFIVDAYYVPG